LNAQTQIFYGILVFYCCRFFGHHESVALSYLMSLSSVLYSIANIISLSIPLFHGEFNHQEGFAVTFSLYVYYDFATLLEVGSCLST